MSQLIELKSANITKDKRDILKCNLSERKMIIVLYVPINRASKIFHENCQNERSSTTTVASDRTRQKVTD